MIDFKRKIVFIHIPKTGGTSVEAALLDDTRIKNHNLVERDRLISSTYRDNFCLLSHPHSSLKMHRDFLKEDFKDYLVFTIIRNPYELAFSRFCFQYRYKEQDFFTVSRFEQFLEIYKFPFRYETLIPIEEELYVDAIFEFHRFGEQLNSLLEKEGFESVDIPHSNKSPLHGYDYKAFYNERTRDRVSRLFSREIKRFGWTFEGTHPEVRTRKDLPPQVHHRDPGTSSLFSRVNSSLHQRLYSNFCYLFSKGVANSSHSFLTAKKPICSEPVSVSLCSHPPRYPLLKFSVFSLLRQVDAMYVYLNNIDYIPWWLKHEKISVTTASEADGDLKSSGKYYFTHEINGYHLIVDDDLIYPADYVSQMIQKLEMYDRHCLICCHGSVLRYPTIGYYNQRITTSFMQKQDVDVRVHIAAFNSVACHTDVIRYTLDDFPTLNMDDIYGSLKARSLGLPIVAIAKPKNWIKRSPPVNIESTIFYNRDSYEEKITDVLRLNEELIFSPTEDV